MPAVQMQRSTSGPLPRLGRNESRPKFFPEGDEETRTPSLAMAKVSTAEIREFFERQRQESSELRNSSQSEGRRVFHKHGGSHHGKRKGLVKKRPQSAVSSLESTFEETKRHIEDFFFRPYNSSGTTSGDRATVVPSNRGDSEPPIRRLPQRTPTRWVECMKSLHATGNDGNHAYGRKPLTGAGSMPQVPTMKGHSRMHITHTHAMKNFHASHAVAMAATIRNGSLGYLGHQQRRYQAC